MGTLLISPTDAEQMARFMNYVDSNIARKVGKLVGWREKFWGRRYRSIVVSDEDDAQVARLRYLLAHGAKEDLVLSPLDWPGLQAARELVDGTMAIDGVWYDATAAYRDRSAGKERPPSAYEQPETIHLSPLPCWRHLDAERYRQRIAEIVASIEKETKERHRVAGTTPTGVAFLLRGDPHETPRHVKRSPAPAFHTRSKEAWLILRDAYASFVASYREAAEKLRRGQWPVAFPSGCFPLTQLFQHTVGTQLPLPTHGTQLLRSTRAIAVWTAATRTTATPSSTARRDDAYEPLSCALTRTNRSSSRIRAVRPCRPAKLTAHPPGRRSRPVTVISSLALACSGE